MEQNHVVKGIFPFFPFFHTVYISKHTKGGETGRRERAGKKGIKGNNIYNIYINIKNTTTYASPFLPIVMGINGEIMSGAGRALLEAPL